MVTALVLISIILVIAGVPQTSKVSFGTTLVALAACFGIWARIAQASAHHEQDKEALQKVTKR